VVWLERNVSHTLYQNGTVQGALQQALTLPGGLVVRGHPRAPQRYLTLLPLCGSGTICKVLLTNGITDLLDVQLSILVIGV
jgi:hypothetical protein